YRTCRRIRYHPQAKEAPMNIGRRGFLAGAAVAAVSAATTTAIADDKPQAIGNPPSAARGVPNRIGVSTYSFWQFRLAELRDVEKCIDLAYEMGFDGVEILHRQMEKEDNATCQRIKQRAYLHGMDLMSFSTHQTFMS